MTRKKTKLSAKQRMINRAQTRIKNLTKKQNNLKKEFDEQSRLLSDLISEQKEILKALGIKSK